jgi:hypothetical protein
MKQNSRSIHKITHQKRLANKRKYNNTLKKKPEEIWVTGT